MTIIYNKSNNVIFRKQLRETMTKSETVLWKHLKGKQLNFKFRRQYGVGKYIVDFYCPTLRLAVEIDGLTHANEQVFEKDVLRQRYLENLGIVVKRYGSEQVLENIEQVLEDVFQTCSMLSKSNTYTRRGQRLDPSLPSPS